MQNILNLVLKDCPLQELTKVTQKKPQENNGYLKETKINSVIFILDHLV